MSVLMWKKKTNKGEFNRGQWTCTGLMDTKYKIEKILHANLSIAHLKITDDSDKHIGHSEVQKSGGGHFSIFVVSEDFKDKTIIQRHRMIYDLLREELKTNIHALSIKAQTEEEF